jgi:hypothetical protein
MTQDEIIALAMEAEFVSRGNTSREESELFVCTDKDIVHFANLVAAKEREACAKLCDDLPVPPHVSSDYATVWDVATLECGDAIRARGQA